jgi:sirohydrochlorin cobaltochelatase
VRNDILKTKSQSEKSIGVLLIGHGSSLPNGNSVAYELTKMYKKMSDYPVELGFMNIEKPSIRTSINNLAKKGVKNIIAVPLFIAHGVHTKQDIPYMLGLGEARKDAYYYNKKQEEIEFDGEITYIEPFGPDPRIVDVIEKKVEEALID